jgi:opacity protein-like surface antigen
MAKNPNLNRNTMNIKLITVAALSIATLTIAHPVQAQTKPSQIGPSLSFGGGTTVFGVDSRFPVSQNLSLRPTLRFPSGGVVVGTSATYDFDISGDYRLEPYIGAGLNVYTGDNNNNGANVSGYAIGGADYALSDQFTLKGSVVIPLKSEYSTDITLGVGYKF